MGQSDYYTSDTFRSDDEFRMEHAKHVYNTLNILFYQFFFTFTCVTLVTFFDPVYLFVRANIETLFWISAFGGLAVVLYMTLFAARQTVEQLSVFTVLETILVCCVTTLYGQDVVSLAMITTFGVCGGLAVYALTTKNNHTGLFGPLMSALTCLCLMGLINIFVKSAVLETIQLYFGTLIFLGYIIVDVQIFLSDKTQITKYHRDDLHIVAAMNIYLDVINVFLRFMEIIDRNKSSSSGTKKDKN